MIHVGRKSYLEPEHNLLAIAIEQGPVVPASKPLPDVVQRVREADPTFVVDNKLNVVGSRKLSCGFVGY